MVKRARPSPHHDQGGPLSASQTMGQITVPSNSSVDRDCRHIERPLSRHLGERAVDVVQCSIIMQHYVDLRTDESASLDSFCQA
jgi:hypothetical protein